MGISPLAAAWAALTVLTVVLFIRLFIRRARSRRLEDYQETLPLLHCMMAGTDGSEDPLAVLAAGSLGKAVRRRASGLIVGWDARDIEDVSAFIAAHWLNGAVPAEAVAAFLSEEQELIRRTPDFVTLHIWRLKRRFAPFFGAGQGV